MCARSTHKTNATAQKKKKKEKMHEAIQRPQFISLKLIRDSLCSVFSDHRSNQIQNALHARMRSNNTHKNGDGSGNGGGGDGGVNCLFRIHFFFLLQLLCIRSLFVKIFFLILSVIWFGWAQNVQETTTSQLKQHSSKNNVSTMCVKEWF